MHNRYAPITRADRGSCLERITQAPTRGDGEERTNHTTNNTCNQESITHSNKKATCVERKRQERGAGERTKRTHNVLLISD